MDKEQLLEELSVLQLQDLISKLKTGEATAGHHSAINGLLRQNNIKLNLENKDTPLTDLLQTLQNRYEEYEQ
jgi:hypothetical protein